MKGSMPRKVRNAVNEQLACGPGQRPLLEFKGLPSDIETMLVSLRRRASELIARVTKDDALQPKIYVDFIDDDRFNAIAMRLDAKYVILINEGVIATLPALYRNLFSLPQFAIHIGDAARENVPANVPVQATNGLSDLARLMRSRERLPICPDRNLIAATLAHRAFNFLIMHELGHIRNGHLAYKATSGTASMAEETHVAPATDKALSLHTFEMDADSHAVVRCVNDELALTGGTWSDPSRKVIERVHATLEGSIYAYFLAVYPLFRCLGMGTWSPDTIWKRTHPPPAMRQYMMHLLVHAHVSRLENQTISADKTLDIARTVMSDVEQGLKLWTGTIPDLTGFALAAKLFPSYGQQLNRRWIEMHPTLDALKLGGRLAPPNLWTEEPREGS